MYVTMRGTEDVLRNVRSTREGFVLVSLYSWMIITFGVAIARFVRGLVIHKIKFGGDDAAALAGSVRCPNSSPSNKSADKSVGRLYWHSRRLAVRT